MLWVGAVRAEVRMLGAFPGGIWSHQSRCRQGQQAECALKQNLVQSWAWAW